MTHESIMFFLISFQESVQMLQTQHCQLEDDKRRKSQRNAFIAVVFGLFEVRFAWRALS